MCIDFGRPSRPDGSNKQQQNGYLGIMDGKGIGVIDADKQNNFVCV